MNDNRMSIGAEDGLLALLGRVSEAALLVSAQGQVMYCNQRLPDWLECGPLTGTMLADLVAPAYRPEFGVFHQRGLQSEADCSLEVLNVRKEAAQMHLRGTPALYAGQPAVAITVERYLAEHVPALNTGAENGSNHQQALQAALQHEQMYRIAFDCSPVAIAVARESDGIFVEANTEFLRLHGYTREELLGHSNAELQLWDSDEMRQQAMETLKTKGKVDGVLVKYRRKTGASGYWLATIRQMHIQGECFVIGALTEFTELHRQKQLILESERRYRLLSQATFEGVAVIKRGVVVEVNEQLCRILGYGAEEIVGKTVVDHFVAPAYRTKAFAQIAKGGESCNEYLFVRKDGQQIQVEVRSSDFDIGGELHRLSAIRDITTRRENEARLIDMQTRYQSLMDSNILGVGITHKDGSILEANDYYLNVLGVSRAQLEAGQLRWRDHTPKDDIALSIRADEELLATGKCMPLQKHYIHSSGVLVPVVVALTERPNYPGQRMVFILDISPLKFVERKLTEANQRLTERATEAEAANYAKTRFLASISHELRTPLHTILGQVGWLRKQHPDTLASPLKAVESSAVTLLRFIDDLLEFNLDASNANALQPDWMDLAYLRSTLSDFGNVLAEKASNRFAVVMAHDLPSQLFVDERRLLQVLQNLVSNACKYTNEGRVTVRIEQLHKALSTGPRQMRAIRFSVQDSGRGISAEELEHIFEPLYRGASTQDQSGIGLGLTIARQWAHSMGSEITVTSTPGRGSLFQFDLELQSGNLGQNIDTAEQIAVQACRTYRSVLNSGTAQVLIVDDNADALLVISDVCEFLGYGVLQAANGQDALRICDALASPCLAILVDQYMPGLDGWAFLQRVRRIPGWEATPMVLVSASSVRRPAGFPTELSFDLVLNKPLDEMALKCFLCRGLPGVVRTADSCWHERLTLANAELTKPPGLALQHLDELLAMGRLFQVMEWANDLARDGRYAACAREVIRMAEEADLPGLQRQLTHWQKSDKQGRGT